MKRVILIIAVLITRSLCAAGLIPPDQFLELHKMILPQPGESKWAQLPWLTRLTEARQRAAAEDKPLLVWAAGGGHQLGRC